MIDPTISTLITKLVENTNDGRLIWDKTGTSNEYTVKIHGTRILIDRWADEDEDHVAEFSVFNDNGDQIVHYAEGDKQRNSDYELIKTLHDVVIKKYFKVEETIAELFDALDKPVTYGQEGSKSKQEEAKDDDDIPF